MKKNSMTRTFMKYVSSNVLGMIGISCYILADTFFVATGIGSDALAALNFALSIYGIINGLGLMIGVGGATKFAFLRAENQPANGNRIFHTSLKLGCIVGVVIVLVGVFFSAFLAKLLGADSTTMPMTKMYLLVICCGAPLFIINNILLAFIRNDGGPRRAMWAMVIGSLANIILDYVFIFLFQWGMFGAAIATTIAPLMSIGILLCHFRNRTHQLHFYKTNWQVAEGKAILTLGLSTFIVEISATISLIVFNYTIFHLQGNIGVAAYGIVANIAFVMLAIFTGIGQGIQPLISYYYEKRESITYQKILKATLILAVIGATIIYTIIVVFAKPIVELFNREHLQVLSELATQGLKSYFIGFFFASVNIVWIAYFNSINQTLAAFIVSILRGMVLLIPMVFLLAYLGGMNGIWLSFPIVECLVVCSILINKVIKKRSQQDFC